MANSLSDLINNSVKDALYGSERENQTKQYFQRKSTFAIYQNLAADEAPETETSAEIIAVSPDGNTVLYTDSQMERLGFVDITDLSAPVAKGFLALDGEPTSVAVKGQYALVVVNTSENYKNTSGQIVVVDISDILSPTVVRTLEISGQPDSIAISPKGNYAAVAVENERDEEACADGDGGLIDEAHDDEDKCNELGGELGGLPQYPAGYLAIVDMNGQPAAWSVSDMSLEGLAIPDSDDPEPEYVAINHGNLAAVSLQENNGMVLVDLEQSKILQHYDAGSVDLTNVDATKNGLIDPIDDLLGVLREPDAVSWLSDMYVVTANEGDYLGGSRSFTIFDIPGGVKYEAATDLENKAIENGHLPEKRAAKKGVEPEGVTSAIINGRNYLFVGSERGNFIAVYTVKDPTKPEYLQMLPTGVGPEGLLAVPGRNAFLVASEKDDAGEGFRSMLTAYELSDSSNYPQITSAGNDELIGWAGLSGLVADRNDAKTLYSVSDSVMKQSYIYTIDAAQEPAKITSRATLKKSGQAVAYDLEGITQSASGDFWLVSEGKPGSSNNLLILTSAEGAIKEEYKLPEAIQAQQKKFGFEGVTVTGTGANEKVHVAVQREWEGDPDGMVKIASFMPASGEWSFVYYPLDTPVTGWVGLADMVALDDGRFAILERDNQQGDSAAIKRIYTVDLDAAKDTGLAYPVLEKSLARDVLPDMKAANGWVPDKVEGLAVGADGEVYLITDNDGLDDAVGETQFLRLGQQDSAFN
nr:esterase-like activity of phytase family protein [Pseudoteredinibacter isoporae]